MFSPNQVVTTTLEGSQVRPSNPQPSASSPFIFLPAELRMEIYKHFFHGRVYPAIRFGMMRRPTRIKMRFQDRYIINITRTCHLCRAEAWHVFRELVTVAFLESELLLAAKKLSSTILDITKLQQVAIVGPLSPICQPKYVLDTYSTLETVHLILHDSRRQWWQPLRALVDPQYRDLSLLAQDEQKLNHIFLDITRYDWLTNSRVAEITNIVCSETYCGPRVLFSSPIVFEEARGVELHPDSNGGVRFVNQVHMRSC